MSNFDKGDLTWLKSVADGAMDNLLSVGRAERTLLHIAELEAEVARLRDAKALLDEWANDFVRLAESIAGQQAMPDDSWREELAAILAKRKEEGK